MNASPKQISYLIALATKKGYASVVEASDAYGFGLKGASSLTIGQASELIGFLKNGVTHEMQAAADADRAAMFAKYNLKDCKYNLKD